MTPNDKMASKVMGIIQGNDDVTHARMREFITIKTALENHLYEEIWRDAQKVDIAKL